MAISVYFSWALDPFHFKFCLSAIIDLLKSNEQRQLWSDSVGYVLT